MRKHILSFGALAALLSACVATGAKVTEDQLTQFHRGETTIDQVVRSLGQPTTSMLLPTGDRMIVYSYVQASPRAATFIPIVGAFAGGADSQSNSAMLTFDHNGVLKNYSASSSAFGSGMGLASGATFSQTPQQPRQAPPD